MMKVAVLKRGTDERAVSTAFKPLKLEDLKIGDVVEFPDGTNGVVYHNDGTAKKEILLLFEDSFRTALGYLPDLRKARLVGNVESITLEVAPNV